jgi:ABC-type cobalt transport system, ATPase component
MSIELKNIAFTYGQGTAFEHCAIKNIDLKIEKNEFIGIIGQTGSGKSTLVQLLNGLLKATAGDILYDGKSIYEKNYDMKTLRQKVGLVFQYPEHQLFEVDVLSDVCFGPRNLGLSSEEAKERAKEALAMVGMKESHYTKSPFELSGGQKRRVAIAGVLAMKPEYLILDEPSAGLDPKARDEILGTIAGLKEKTGISIILVSHSMEDVAKYVDRLIVMNKSEIIYDDTPKSVFKNYKELEKIGLRAPQITYLVHRLKKEGIDIDTDITRLSEAREALIRLIDKEREINK